MEVKEIFKNKFNLPQEGFLQPIDLIDVDVGFSVYKDRYEKEFKSLFRVYIDNKDYGNENSKKPVVVTAVYGKTNEDGGITVYSSGWKRSNNLPIELISEKDFFYDIKTNDFLYNNKIINGIEILKKVDGWHMKTTKPIRGFWLRFKLVWFHSILAFFVKLIFDIFSIVRYFISGQKARIFDRIKNNPDSPNKVDMNVFFGKTYIGEPEVPMKIFDYMVPVRVALLWSLFHLFFYTLFYFLQYYPIYLKIIFTNGFLIIVYGVASIIIFNKTLKFIYESKISTIDNLLVFIQNRHLKLKYRKIKI